MKSLIFSRLFIVFAVLSFCVQQSSGSGKKWLVTDFGARGDASTLDTPCIQAAIDACALAGGGTVEVSPGVYLSGTLFLKSGVHLKLCPGAEIRASENREHYTIINSLNKNGIQMFGQSGTFLVYAENANNVSISGQGKISGSGHAFWESEMFSTFVYKPKPWRPWGLICFVNCKNIRFRDVSLENSPCYTLWNIGCNDVIIRGITIKNNVRGPNTDGIDIDCCRRVRIANCHIEGGDDAIAIKSDSGRLGDYRPCENIIVKNCRLSSPPACGVRVGYEGDSPIRNCRFRNLDIYHSNHGINLISTFAQRELIPIEVGTRIENISFSKLAMDYINQPIYLWMDNAQGNAEQPAVYMKNISISRVVARGVGSSFVGSSIAKNIENISLNKISMEINRPAPADGNYYAGVWGSMEPYVVHFKNIENLSIKNTDLVVAGDKATWKQVYFFDNIKGLSIKNVQGLSSPEIDTSTRLSY